MLTPDFDKVCSDFSVACRYAADWKHHFFGAAYSTRVKAAIHFLKAAIAVAERNAELAPLAAPADRGAEERGPCGVFSDYTGPDATQPAGAQAGPVSTWVARR